MIDGIITVAADALLGDLPRVESMNRFIVVVRAHAQRIGAEGNGDEEQEKVNGMFHRQLAGKFAVQDACCHMMNVSAWITERMEPPSERRRPCQQKPGVREP